MKQTAVEWLVNEANLLENNGWILPLIEQAKEMEKLQIIDAATWGTLSESAEHYYNDKYGSKGSDEPKKIRFTEEEWSALNNGTSQTEISERRFTEKDIRFAYMQGYNRGVDGNPNHMESYIEHINKK
jgi:hypothetical protein